MSRYIFSISLVLLIGIFSVSNVHARKPSSSTTTTDTSTTDCFDSTGMTSGQINKLLRQGATECPMTDTTTDTATDTTTDTTTDTATDTTTDTTTDTATDTATDTTTSTVIGDDTLTNSCSSSSTATFTINGQSYSFSWTPPSENVDGSTLDDLKGYRVYMGTDPNGDFSISFYLDCTNIPNITAEPGVYYFALVAINASGYESQFSNIMSFTAE